jgi:hypothetical protein
MRKLFCLFLIAFLFCDSPHAQIAKVKNSNEPEIDLEALIKDIEREIRYEKKHSSNSKWLGDIDIAYLNLIFVSFFWLLVTTVACASSPFFSSPYFKSKRNV